MTDWPKIPKDGRHGRALVTLIGLTFSLLTAACAPNLAPSGPNITAPRLAESSFTTADGISLPMRRWFPPAISRSMKFTDGITKVRVASGNSGDAENHAEIKAVILALHGFNDYSKSFENTGKILAALGMAVFAYDQRGFGEAPHRGLWAGHETLTGDLAAVSRILRRRYPGKPLYLLGDSMGGAVILAAFDSADPPEAEGVILAAPAVWARSTMPWPQRAVLWLSARTIPWVKFSGSGLKIQASDNIEMLRKLGRDPLVIKETRVDAVHGLVDLMDRALTAGPALHRPALLLYGDKDQIVPREPTLLLWSELPGTQSSEQRLALYGNGWHMLLRDLDAGVVLADIIQWIEDRAEKRGRSLPSGAETPARETLKVYRERPENPVKD